MALTGSAANGQARCPGVKNRFGLSFRQLPTIEGVPMVVGTKDGKRTLIVRDSQHEYVFVEAS